MSFFGTCRLLVLEKLKTERFAVAATRAIPDVNRYTASAPARRSLRLLRDGFDLAAHNLQLNRSLSCLRDEVTVDGLRDAGNARGSEPLHFERLAIVGDFEVCEFLFKRDDLHDVLQPIPDDRGVIGANRDSFTELRLRWLRLGRLYERRDRYGERALAASLQDHRLERLRDRWGDLDEAQIVLFGTVADSHQRYVWHN